jgi:hypothetical protein
MQDDNVRFTLKLKNRNRILLVLDEDQQLSEFILERIEWRSKETQVSESVTL